MTNEELEKYKQELYILQNKAINLTRGKISISRKDAKELNKIGKRIKEIKKILNKALKESRKNGK